MSSHLQNAAAGQEKVLQSHKILFRINLTFQGSSIIFGEPFVRLIEIINHLHDIRHVQKFTI